MNVGRVTAVLTLPALLAVAACELPDDARCRSGFVYEPAVGACRMVPDVPPPPDDVREGQEGDGDAEGDGGPGGVSGLGAPCSSDGDCSGFDADYCSTNPSDGDSSCTIRDCAPGDCPHPWRCCDCTSFGYPAFCVSPEAIDLAASFCRCE